MFDLSSAGLQNNRVTHELDLITGALISASQHPKNISILMPFPLIYLMNCCNIQTLDGTRSAGLLYE